MIRERGRPAGHLHPQANDEGSKGEMTTSTSGFKPQVEEEGEKRAKKTVSSKRHYQENCACDRRTNTYIRSGVSGALPHIIKLIFKNYSNHKGKGEL